ncbi:MAG: hypothetical protein KC731_14130, partial [Myxococcales bacterium]|nr:hypothetical protein [Myxococcales bacterium]
MRFVAVALVASGCSLLNAFDDVRPGSGGGGSGGTTSSATGGAGPGGQDASGGAGGAGAAGGKGGVGAGNLLFEDDFARADGDAVGNGWIEKTPAVFSLAGGKAVKAATMDN